MVVKSRLHSVIFSSGNNPRSTIEFVENRGLSLFEGFEWDRKQINPVKSSDIESDIDGVPVPMRETEFSQSDEPANRYQSVDFNLPVLVGGKNGSGKTSLLCAIKILCDLLQESNIGEDKASEAWSKLDSMNISHLDLLFSTIIPELTDEENSSFTESVTRIVMDSTDKDETLKWCDGIQIRNPISNISEVEMYRESANFQPVKKRGALPPHKTTIGESRIKRFLTNLSGQRDGSPEAGLRSVDYLLLLDEEVKNVLSRMESTEYTQHEIQFQEAVFIDVDRKSVGEKLDGMTELVPKIANRYDELTTDPELLREELNKISSEEWFSLIYGPVKNVIEEGEDGKWDMRMYASAVIEDLQDPYTSFQRTPDWFRPRGNWIKKSDAMDFVTEGALLDLTSWLTGIPQLERSFRYGERGLEWIDTLWDQEWKGGLRKYEKNKGVREAPSLEVALKKDIVKDIVAKLVGIGKDEKSVEQVDIIKRMNFFTPIQEIRTQYLTSGQRQVLALIIAVRNSKEGSLILIDEPELSLHVDWQVDLVEQLHAPLTGSQLVIATHSPDIALNHNHLCSIISTEPKETHQRD